MISNPFIDEKVEKLPSLDAKVFNPEDDLALMYRYIYLDNLFKQQQSKVNIPPFDVSSEKLNDLTVVLTHTDSFLKADKLSLSNILDYFLYLGVTNIIIANTTSNLKYISYYKRFFRNFMLLEYDQYLENKTQVINRALKSIKSKYVLVCDDNGLISMKNFFKCFLAVVDQYDFVYPANRCFKKINSVNDFLDDFDFNLLDTGEKEFINFDYNCIFCRLKSLKKIGSYNPNIKSEKTLSDELNIRLNHSNYKVIRMNEPLYLIGFIKHDIDYDSQNELVKQFNLSKLGYLNVLINQNEEMFYFSNEENEENDYVHDGNYLISVIIPVRNCEKFYLDRSISSLKNQTIGFENIEVILVDDASKYESSIELIENYDRKYDNITSYFLKLNKGPGFARNFGVKQASSDFVCFLDHDDYYVDDFLEKAYANMNSHKIDVFFANYVDMSLSHSLFNWTFLKDEKVEYLKNFRDNVKILDLFPSIWSKCYRRKFLIEKNNYTILYPVAEDKYLNLKSLFEADGILVMNIPSVIYNLRTHDNEDLRSITLIINKKMMIDRIKCYEKILSLFLEYYPQKAYLNLYNNLKYWLDFHLFKSDISKKEFFAVLKESRHIFNIMCSEGLNEVEENYVDIFKSISNNEFENVYDYYLNQ